MLRLAIRVARADAELVLAELLALAPSGVEESASADGQVIEYAVYGAPGELPELPDLEAAAGDALVEIHTTEIADDWADRWRQFHEPIEVGGTLYVRPPWEPARAGLLDVMIDPGQAFGTGAHATTRMCLELLVELAASGELGSAPACVDVGCGSGVLAVAAAKLGVAPVLGLDHERESVRATLENADVNGVGGAVDARRFDLLRDGKLPGAPLMLANLLRPLLLCVARAGFRGGPPRTLIASGLLPHETSEVAEAFAPHGLVVCERREHQGWAALLLAASGPR